MTNIEAELEQCQSLVSQMLDTKPEKYVASPILRDFKLCLDGLRLTLWAVIQSQAEGSSDGKAASMILAGKLVEFRTKRLIQLLSDLQQDAQDGRLSSAKADVPSLLKALRAALDSVSRVAQ
jgi:hypothetical protein